MMLSLLEAGAQLVSQSSGPVPKPDDTVTIVPNPDKSSHGDGEGRVAAKKCWLNRAGITMSKKRGACGVVVEFDPTGAR